MLASQSSGTPQEHIGRYEVLRKIATGGMAELFLAKQVGMEGFEKVVAIKQILAHLAYDEEFINMFRDEARIVAKLSHPNIVQIYDLGKSNETYFIAMEYIPGRNLSSIAKKAKALGEKLPPQNIARCLAQACEGLYYAHTRQDIDGRPLQIVHRDVSPQNIILSFSGTVKLVDFGIAKAAKKIAHTRAGVLKGKYAYMSPEQIRGEGVDARSDLFAVGIVLYELLCGRRPFEKENSIQTLKAIVMERHVDCRVLNPDIPDGLASIIDRALSKKPDDRFEDAQELQVALEDFVSTAPERVNNIKISKWVTDLFKEELSREQGGTVVFQGVGEVILPDVRATEGPRSNPEASEPVSLDDLDAPLMRGRGGGSVDTRPPIEAPSNAMFDQEGDDPRESLIEEGVIDRGGGAEGTAEQPAFHDDATVLGFENRGRPSTTEEPLPASARLEQPGFDDGKTEFAKPDADSATVAGVPLDEIEGHPAAGGALIESDVEFPTSDSDEDSAAPPLGELLGPLGGTTDSESFASYDEAWDEATIGYPGSAGEPAIELPDGADKTGDLVDEDTGWEGPDSFEGDATIGGGSFGWESEPSKKLRAEKATGAPVVLSPSSSDEFEDSALELDFGDDAPDADVPHDATIVQSSLTDEDSQDGDFLPDATIAGDSTIAVPGISDEMLERAGHGEDDDEQGLTFEEPALPDGVSSSSQYNDDRTIASGQLFESEPELWEVGDESGATELPSEATSAGWPAHDATIAGGPALAQLEDPADGGEDFAEEPELPPSASSRSDVDLDAQTSVGVTSDYVSAGVRPPEGGLYDDPDTDLPESSGGPQTSPERPVTPGMPSKRGQERLGAIQLNRVSVPKNDEPPVDMFSSPELESLDDFSATGAFEATGDFDEPTAEAAEDELPIPDSSDLPALTPAPLDEPELSPGLPKPSRSAKDEYSDLLSPRVPAPITKPAGNSAPMGIGSTNVPPANLSLSQVLSHPSTTSRSKMLNASSDGIGVINPEPRVSPTPATGSGLRSATLIGRQIREVVRAEPETSPPEAPVPMMAPGPPQPGYPPQAMPPGYPPHAMPSMVAPPRHRGRNILIGVLVTIAAVLVMGVVALLVIPVAPNQRLTIRSRPTEANIFINGQQKGKTPMTVSGLVPETTYLIRLELNGYVSSEKEVLISKDRPVGVVSFQLRKASTAPDPSTEK